MHNNGKLISYKIESISAHHVCWRIFNPGLDFASNFCPRFLASLDRNGREQLFLAVTNVNDKAAFQYFTILGLSKSCGFFKIAENFNQGRF